MFTPIYHTVLHRGVSYKGERVFYFISEGVGPGNAKRSGGTRDLRLFNRFSSTQSREDGQIWEEKVFR